MSQQQQRKSGGGVAGHKRPAGSAPSTPRTPNGAGAAAGKPVAAAAPHSKKAKHTPQRTGPAPAKTFDEDSSDDDAAILRLKQAAAAKSPSASARPAAAAAAADDEDDGFEVAAASGDEDEDAGAGQDRAPPSENEDEDDNDDAMEEADEEEAAPARKPLPPPKQQPSPALTPAAASKPVATKQPTTPAPAAKPAAAAAKPATPAAAPKTPVAAAAAAKPSPALKAAAPTPKPAATTPQAKKPVAAVSDSSSESDDEDETPAPAASKSATPAKTAASPKLAAASPKLAAATPAAAPAAVAAKKATPTPVSTPAAAPRKPAFSVVGGDSSESSDEDEPTATATTPAYKKPQPPRNPTPLKGDASVNPPPKTPKTPKPAAAGAAASPAAASSFSQPLTRPATAAHTGRAFTVSIALPGSIVANAQSKELRTYVAGQIARAAATFNVDEIIVFAEGGKQESASSTAGHFAGATRSTDPDVFLARILQYLETPQYLRKLLFPRHADLAAAGLLNPLDSPHHVRADEEVPYREGVVVNRPVAARKHAAGSDGAAADAPVEGCWANIGLKNEAFIPRAIDVGTRVTVHIPQMSGSTTRGKVGGRAVAPSTPREKLGTYWGYTTRLASSLGAVWSECPFPGGYDLSIGTSEHGEDIHAKSFELKPFNHLLLVFGGLAGLEEHIAADETLGVKRPQDLFQSYVNCVVGQGCRTIRTEEAIPITLAALYRHVRTNQPPAAGNSGAASAD